VGAPPPVPELLLDPDPDPELDPEAELLLDAALLEAELLLDAALLEAELALDDALDPPAPPPAPVVEPLVDEAGLPPIPLVELSAEVGLEPTDDDSSALVLPPVPSSFPAAQLAGKAATTTALAASNVKESTRRPTLARPIAKKDRGNIPRSSTRKPQVRLRPRASGEPAADWCSVRECERRAARGAAGGGKQRCRC
jgi:hypothetical protein